jgi:hypothetical protein
MDNQFHDWHWWYENSVKNQTDTTLTNLRKIIREGNYLEGSDKLLWYAMDSAADMAQFERSYQWIGPWQNGEAHTLLCLKRYSEALDSTQQQRAEYFAWEAKYGKSHCLVCHGAGGFYEPATQWERENSEVCEACLGNERAYRDHTADGHEFGPVKYKSDPICPQCGTHHIEGADPDADEFKPRCLICGWKVGDSAPSIDDYPECTCPTR